MAYYWEKVQGHADILNNQRPIQEAIRDPATIKETKQRLINAKKAREFATATLKLPDNDSYRNYVDIKRDYAVWTVVATPPYSTKPKQWCFLIVGCLSYRGYFSEQKANEFAAQLKKQNMDVYVSGIKAYSTLGWFDDPLLSSMLYKSEAYRVGIIFHELAHQQFYLQDDTAFNEAFASTVELLGIKLWFEENKKLQKYKQYRIAKKRDEQFKQLLQDTRQVLMAHYQNTKNSSKLKTGKQFIFNQLKENYTALKIKWNGYDGYDRWMNQPLNNAHLAMIATYNDLIPAFKKMYLNANKNFTVFYKQVETLAEKPKQQRDLYLNTLMPAGYARHE